MIFVPVIAILFVVAFAIASGRGEAMIANLGGVIDHGKAAGWRFLVAGSIWCVAAVVMYHWTSITLAAALWAAVVIPHRVAFNLSRRVKDGRGGMTRLSLWYISPSNGYDAGWIMVLMDIDRKAAEINHKTWYFDKYSTTWRKRIHNGGKVMYAAEAFVLIAATAITLVYLYQHPMR